MTHDGQRPITIAHLEPSGELIKQEQFSHGMADQMCHNERNPEFVEFKGPEMRLHIQAV